MKFFLRKKSLFVQTLCQLQIIKQTKSLIFEYLFIIYINLIFKVFIQLSHNLTSGQF